MFGQRVSLRERTGCECKLLSNNALELAKVESEDLVGVRRDSYAGSMELLAKVGTDLGVQVDKGEGLDLRKQQFHSWIVLMLLWCAIRGGVHGCEGESERRVVVAVMVVTVKIMSKG